MIVLSEYGIVPVSRPVHPNRVLREAGLIAYRMELGREVIDIGGSEAFAMADHQISHVYVRDPARVAEVRALLEAVPGVGEVLDEDGKREHGLDHERSGELVLIAEPDSWFTYYYWLDDDKAPDYARTVDIHRKPGYDPVELFLDPAIRVPPLALGSRLVRKKLGFRTLMDVIPLDASLVRGSHGRIPDDPSKGPLLMTRQADLLPDGERRRHRRARPDPPAPRRARARGGGAMTLVGRKADHLRIAAGADVEHTGGTGFERLPAAPPGAARARPRAGVAGDRRCSARGSARRSSSRR